MRVLIIRFGPQKELARKMVERFLVGENRDYGGANRDQYSIKASNVADGVPKVIN